MGQPAVADLGDAGVDIRVLVEDLADDEIARLLEFCFPILNTSDSYSACLALCRRVEDHHLLWSALLTGGAAGTIRSVFI